jgi:hypothetical protein
MASKKVECPKCRKKNFSFDTESLTGQCFSCGHSGGGVKFAKILGVMQESYRPTLKAAPPALTTPSQDCLTYLESRRVTKPDKYGIKWDPSSREIHFPIWSPYRNCRSVMRRQLGASIYINDGMRGRPYLFGKERITNKESIILVEGIFDLLSPGLWGRGVALLGSNLHEDIEYWLHEERFEKIYVWLDPDKTGFEKSPPIINRLQKWHDKVYRVHGFGLDGRDPGEYTMSDAFALLGAVEKTGKHSPGRQEQ